MSESVVLSNRSGNYPTARILLKLTGEVLSSSSTEYSQQTSNGSENLEKEVKAEVAEPVTKKEDAIISCTCRKSRCIKMYCPCFNDKKNCDSECFCRNCENTAENEIGRTEAISKVLKRNIHAFDSKVTHVDSANTKTGEAKHMYGCHCRKSRCLKKYCECYQVRIKCCENCTCSDCHNGRPLKDKTLDDIDMSHTVNAATGNINESTITHETPPVV